MNTLNKVKRELEVLKSWGIETVPIDKVLDMIGEDDYHTEEKTLFFPSETEKVGVDKYFREIPMYVNSDMPTHLYQDRYSTVGIIPKSNVWVH